jgi:hypothetical protein
VIIPGLDGLEFRVGGDCAVRSRGMPLDVVQACRQFATEVWRGDRTHMFDRVGGLVNASAVRTRMKMLTGPLVNATDLGEPARAALAAIDLEKHDPLSLVEQTEFMLRAQVPDRNLESASVEALSSSSNRRLAMSLVVQSIAGRLGVWATRDEELTDAVIGRRLVKFALVRDDLTRGAMLTASADFYASGDLMHVVSCLLGADRLRRSIEGLLKAAVILWKMQEHAQALWMIRTCLLEEVHYFVPETLLVAQRTESILRFVVERAGNGGMGERVRTLDATQASIERALFGAPTMKLERESF